MLRASHDTVDRPEWGPLERVAEICRERSAFPVIVVADFMYMGCRVSHGRSTVHHYKHIETRRYLNLDSDGRAYVRTELPSWPRREGQPLGSWYEPWTDLLTAVRAATDSREPEQRPRSAAPRSSARSRDAA